MLLPYFLYKASQAEHSPEKSNEQEKRPLSPMEQRILDHQLSQQQTRPLDRDRTQEFQR